MPRDVKGIHGRTGFNQDKINSFIEPKAYQEMERMSPNPTINTADMEDMQGTTGFNQDWINATEKVIEPNADQEMKWMSLNATVTEDMEDIQARIGFNQDGINVAIEPKADPEKERMFPNPTTNTADMEYIQGKIGLNQNKIIVEYAEFLKEYMHAVKQNYGEKVFIQVIYQIQHL
ncbi:hypothetical protein JHK87_052360 [Glycine soja]|nr:hypothetical protein JHK87_052360 [Glycine soja]